MTCLPAELDALLGPLLARDGWLPMALERLEQDPLARHIEREARPACARAARRAGEAMARRARLGPWRTAEEALRAHGVSICDSDAEAVSGPFIHHAFYTAPPPRVTVFAKPLEAAEWLLQVTERRGRLGSVILREVVLAHELFHHLVLRFGAPAAVGPWRRWGVVKAAEEIAAAGFAASWCGVAWAPELLDCLTLAAYGSKSAGSSPWTPTTI